MLINNNNNNNNNSISCGIKKIYMYFYLFIGYIYISYEGLDLKTNQPHFTMSHSQAHSSR